MSLILTTYGAAQILRAALRNIPFTIRYGLFQNEWTPTAYSTLTSVSPAVFSGYAGLLPVNLWSDPTIVGAYGTSSNPPLVWTRGPGLQSAYIFGYYAVDSVPELLWAERLDEYPALLAVPGDQYAVTPSFTETSRY